MISPSKGRYDMLLLQPFGPAACTWQRTYIQETGESPRTAKAQTIRAKICSYSWFFSTYISVQYKTTPDYFLLIPDSATTVKKIKKIEPIAWSTFEKQKYLTCNIF